MSLLPSPANKLPSKFPKNFKFATATAAYQIEGGTHIDGRGKSTWDEIREESGRIADGSDANQSCDGRIKYKEDVELLKTIGVNSYRFSISWSRILPDGKISNISEEGIAYYRDLCEKLSANGIEPIITLFHADMPLTIFDSGSWLNQQNCDHFVDFSELCFKRFGDLVKTWITFNEINMQAWCGMAKFEGQPWHCPNRPHPPNKEQVPYLAATNMLLTHGRIYRLYDSKYRKDQNGIVGITNGGRYCMPATESISDLEARNRALDWLFNYTIEPILGENGDFPMSMRKSLPFLPKFTDEQKELIKGSTDFIGINYYLSHLIKNLEKDGKALSQTEKDGQFDYAEGPWEKICGDTWVRYAPDGLYNLLKYIKTKYNNIPVFITENGCMDYVGAEEGTDVLIDEHRVKYIKGHLESVSKALEKECNVIGYTVWSLMDNFEWDDGFALRFGICRVDYTDPNKTRIMKKSAKFYKEFIDEFKKHHGLD